MSTSSPRPRAKHVSFAGGLMHIELEDGRVIHARYNCFPRLAKASDAQRNRWELVGHGVGIHWLDVDEDLSTDGLLRDAVAVTASNEAAE
jgi:hypothetical protein